MGYFVSICSILLPELDLGFFEKHQQYSQEKNSSVGRQQIEVSPDSVDRIKVIFLGAPAVGKTSIIQQFVWNDFSDTYEPTDAKHTYYPAVIMNDRRYEIKITDLPAIPYFPVNSLYEFADYRFYGLRNASVYVLVFDLSNLDTFSYVKMIREQILESSTLSAVPIFIVGNKTDLVQTLNTNLTNLKSNGASSMGLNILDEDIRKVNIAEFVKERWKCKFLECSAKCHTSVINLFKELIRNVDVAVKDVEDHSPAVDNIREVLSKSRCNLI